MFDKPDEYEGRTGDSFAVKEHVDRLVAIKVEKYEPAVKTVRGEKPAIGARVTLIDGPEAGTSYDDALIFGAVLVPQLKEKVGRHVLGRLYEGEAKDGNFAPYKLAEATDEETEYAVRFLSAKPAAAAPAAAAATPAPVPGSFGAGTAAAITAPKAPWEQ